MSRPPVIHQISWPAVLLQLSVGAIVILISRWTWGTPGVAIGAGLYLAYSMVTRMLLTRSHRRGMATIRRREFSEAIPFFIQSLEFFDSHSWVDRYRAVVMMSPSAMTYREMALANIGFCYAQLGDGVEARRYYAECLNRFPNNGIAQAAMQILAAGRPMRS